MKFFAIFWLIAASVLAGCSGGTGAYPTFDPALDDWCHTFDFHEDAQGFAVDAGEQNILGLQTDATGLLLVSYGYTRNVLVDTVIISVRRPPASVGDITVKADGKVFNITTQLWNAVMPADVEQIYIPYSNTEPINEGADYSSINIHLESDKPLVIESIQVRGNGAPPFPENECQLTTNTPTPDPGTPVGSTTPTPSGTPTTGPGTGTPTPTFTPTACPTGGPPVTDEWSFGTVDSVVGSVWTVSSELAGGVQKITWGYQTGWGYAQLDSQTLISGGSISAYLENVDGDSVFFSSLPEDLRYIYYDAGAGSPFTIEFVFNEGMCPPTPTPAPTGTPGPSNTPGPTSTSSPLWGACLDFTVDPFGFIGVDSTYEIDEGFVQDEDAWGFGRAGLISGRKSKIKIKFAPGQTFSGDIRLSDGGPTNHTSWETVSGNFIVADFTGDAYIPTTTMYVEFDGNNIPLVAQQLCWLDPNPPTRTPTPGATPTGTQPTRTPFPFSSPTATATSYRTPIAPIVVTTTPGIYITSTTIYGGGGGGTPSASSTPGGGGGDGTPEGSGDAGDVLGSAWDIGSGLFKVGGAYLGQVADVSGGMIAAINSAPPTSIGGLPQCMTNPMAHDICAIYWILDWTLFAPNTPGALIIPMIMVLMNFMIAVRFIRWAWKIVSRGEEMTNE